jgi:hypothetical protein
MTPTAGGILYRLYNNPRKGEKIAFNIKEKVEYLVNP